MTDGILPQEPELAVKRLLKFVQDLTTATRDEAQAHAAKEPRDFAAALARKDDLSVTYEKAAQEFRARLEEFKVVDKSLLRELQTAQEELKTLVEENQKVYKR